MMKEIWLFNPDNDLALADGYAHYMAPASARCMAEELAILPIWYADSNGYVLAPSAYNLSFLHQMQTLFGLSINLITISELKETDSFTFHPWGWNMALRKLLLTSGIVADQLPSLDQLQQLLLLSHRKQAIDLFPHLLLNNQFCGNPTYLQTNDECEQYVLSHPSCVLKAPWSGSGKGLNWCKGKYTDLIAGWCKRNIKSQGGVIAEPVYQKEMDFAMEFFINNKNEVSFIGYSTFSTSQSGAYEGNLLISDEQVENLLSGYIDIENIHLLRTKLIRQLTEELVFDYHGFLGVDMMICHFDEMPYYRIHPCVEINLRMNMGIVSHTLYQRLIYPNKQGQFKIDYYPTAGIAFEKHRMMEETHPLRLKDQRIESGYLSLIPITHHNHYHAFILIE